MPSRTRLTNRGRTPDNGAAGGRKLPDAVEDKITQLAQASGHRRPTGAAIGRVRDIPDAAGRYVTHLLGALPHPLAGIRMLVDCANGAASGIAARVYQEA